MKNPWGLELNVEINESWETKNEARSLLGRKNWCLIKGDPAEVGIYGTVSMFLE